MGKLKHWSSYDQAVRDRIIHRLEKLADEMAKELTVTREAIELYDSNCSLLESLAKHKQKDYEAIWLLISELV